MPSKKAGYFYVFVISIFLLYFSGFSDLTIAAFAADKSSGIEIIYTADVRGMIYPCA